MKQGIFAAMLTALCVALAIPFASALACDAIPDDAIVAVDELIERSEKIVLVTVDAGTPHPQVERQRLGPVIDPEAERRRATEGRAQAGDRAFATLPLATMTAVEYLKGAGPSRLSRPVTARESDDASFDDHRDTTFWKDRTAGRIRMDADCRPLVHFSPGGTYLLFIGPVHVKAAERIESDADAWLAYVRERLAR